MVLSPVSREFVGWRLRSDFPLAGSRDLERSALVMRKEVAWKMDERKTAEAMIR
jgi:hypothetical protein